MLTECTNKGALCSRNVQQLFIACCFMWRGRLRGCWPARLGLPPLYIYIAWDILYRVPAYTEWYVCIGAMPRYIANSSMFKPPIGCTSQLVVYNHVYTPWRAWITKPFMLSHANILLTPGIIQCIRAYNPARSHMTLLRLYPFTHLYGAPGELIHLSHWGC
jgi:hypothetical protein